MSTNIETGECSHHDTFSSNVKVDGQCYPDVLFFMLKISIHIISPKKGLLLFLLHLFLLCSVVFLICGIMDKASSALCCVTLCIILNYFFFNAANNSIKAIEPL